MKRFTELQYATPVVNGCDIVRHSVLFALTRLYLDVRVMWRRIILSEWNHIFKNQLHFPKLRWWSELISTRYF